MVGLNRKQAAQWVSKATGCAVYPELVRYWEAVGLLRRQRPGCRVPAEYRIDDLVRLRLIAELRREGAPLQRIRRAVRNLRTLFPELRDRPGAWHLAVLGDGRVVHIEGQNLFDLARRPGQSGWLFLLDARDYLTKAQRAIEEHRARVVAG